MVRHEINRGSLNIAYGLDHATGVFLSVHDNRLAWDQNASEEVNALTEKIGTGDGSGDYLQLHTGPLGLGHKVSIAAMKVFMQRYGLPQAHIDEFCGK